MITPEDGQAVIGRVVRKADVQLTVFITKWVIGPELVSIAPAGGFNRGSQKC
jgi:hypothetical protein